MSSFLHSIRWRVQVWHGLILFLVILAFCITVHRLVWDNQLRRIDRNLGHLERALIRGLLVTAPGDHNTVTGAKAADNGPPNPLRLLEYLQHTRPELPADLAAAFRGTEPGYAYFCLWDGDGKVLLASSNVPDGLSYLTVPVSDFNEEWRTRGNLRESLHGSPNGLRSVVGLDLTPEREEMRRYALSLAAVGAGIWFLGLVGGWWLAGRAIRPVQDISTTAERIAEGNLAERIDVAGGDSELDQLGRVLNASFDRLHAAIEQQKRFTADASHELKTPVTILLAETQRALKRERNVVEYRAVIETCRSAAERMRRLTESLLILARQEAIWANGSGERCDLAALLLETVRDLAPLAAERQLTVKTELQPAICLGDPSALSILAANLVANALQHHDRPGGSVGVACGSGSGHVTITVTDDGPGIAPAHLPHLFERFYRTDSARTGGSGHSGLGLAIARSIVLNHGGTIIVANQPGRGTRFNVSLPAAG